jgi:PEGA domain
MKRLMVSTAFVVFFLPTKSHAQSGAVIAQEDAGHASQASCVILKRMGRADRTKSRLYSFGISGKQFRYVEGNLPEGFSLHRKMTDHDVRNLQAQGAQVLVLESDYTPEDLKEARAGCRGETGKTPTHTEAKALPAPVPGPIAATPAAPPIAPTPKAPAPKADDSARSEGATEAALLDVSSTPTEAEVFIDERLSGRTPSTIILMPGDYSIVIKKSGFVVWKKKFKLPSGRTNVDAALVPKAK